MTDVHCKAYHEPRYNLISEVMTEGINEVSYKKVRGKFHMTSHVIVLISGNNITVAHTIGTQAIHTPTGLPPK